MAQGGRDRRQRHAGGDGRDAETMPQAFRARLETLDAGVGHGPGDLPVGGRPRPGPEGLAGGLRRRRAERMDELVGAEHLGKDGDFAPARGAAFQGPDPDRGDLKEAPALIGSGVLAAAGVDELEITNQARNLA